MSLKSPEKPTGFKPPLFTIHGRHGTDMRKLSTTKQYYRTPFPSQKKKPPPHYKFHYDSEVKGWRESQKVTASHRWTKAKDAVRVGNYFIGIRKKPDTFLNIDVKKLVNATKINRTAQSARTMPDPDLTDDTEQEQLERTLTEPTLLLKPFEKNKEEPNDGVWICPVSIRASAERIKRFNWERPKTERKVLVESASKYQAIYLQKLLKEKDKEMKLITNQLIKSNKENVALLKELEGYRGKNYDELYAENITLKDQISRACRENALLAGQVRKENNKTLQKWNATRTVT
ncbi:uncharacterized protein LOC132757167 [Ruditapes philippinarum]|uniref:uncharacterized protein LOC132757167 n=1 Tax=Ruditapes philippinarum TaxID=129788 RepID=UPI00295B2ED6|nr:uncharacterized protein LOC132757167 [Ruditapes philippinarum]